MINKNKKILIMGGSSYVGRHLFARLGPRRSIATYNRHSIDKGVYFDALSMDLSNIIEDPESISHAVILFGDSNPETCCSDVEKSNRLNVESIKRVIDYLRRWTILPVFASSEHVFNGRKGNYVEADPPDPILTYGRQKVEIERYLQKTGDGYIVVRFAKIFGSKPGDGTIFTKWLSAIIEQTDAIKCVDDQIFSPVYIDDVVESIIRLIEGNCKGVFHVSSSKPFTRIQLLRMLLKFVNKYSSVNIKVIPCSIRDFNLKEKRPLNLSMFPKKLVKATGIKLSDVENICKNIVERNFQSV